MPCAASDASGVGTLSGQCLAAKLIHAHSYALRSTGAYHSFATLSRGSAHLMQIVRPGKSTRQMSDDTPPGSGVHVAQSPGRASPARSTNARSFGPGVGNSVIAR